MTFDSAAVEQLIARFLETYESFNDQQYLDDERTYKLKAVERMGDQIGRDKLGGMIEAGQFEQARSAIKRAYTGTFTVNDQGLRQRNNLMNQFDVRALVDLDAERLARGVYDLLYGDDPFPFRFDRWVALLSARQPNCWPAATYYLMLYDPDQHILVKPSLFRRLLSWLGQETSWEVRPSYAAYERYRLLAEELLAALRPLGARDMIDVHSFMWTIAGEDDADDPEDALGDEDASRTPIGLAEWQSSFASENELARHVAQDYPRWLHDTFGAAVEVQPYAERLLHVFCNGQRMQELSLRRVRGVYVLLFQPDTWDTARISSRTSRPKSARLRETWGFRFIMSTFPDYELMKTVTEDTFRAMLGRQTSPLPRTLGDKLRPYVQLAALLDGSSYTPEQIVERLGRISPPIDNLRAAPDPGELVRDLLHLRLLKPLDSGNYRRWSEIDDATIEHMLRYAALTLLVPDGEEYELPALDAPFDGLPHPPAAWPLGGAILPWYQEAGLVRHNQDGTWQSLAGALDPINAQTPTARTLNTFLDHLRRVRDSQRGLPPLDDGPLPVLPPHVLDQRVAEIQRELLIERDTILRIYRSLIAGQHVILSGPPGTGKTHLARLLPRILWRDAEDTVVLRMAASPELPPNADPVEEPLHREGYTVEVVTATEDWGVRHVVGGIAPQLQHNGQSKTLTYAIRHGHLTRAVLTNYDGYDGIAVPALDRLRRRELTGPNDQRYRGHWLVIDEFTRAQIDAAFGSLLTTLGGQRGPTLAVPTEDGGELHVPLPRDFRLIGTLNSFDRHFLNQISEAMKRRFAFIDVLPPGRAYADHEQALAVYRALLRLRGNGIANIAADEAAGVAQIGGVLQVRGEQAIDDGQARVRYRLEVEDNDAEAALHSFWRIFSAIRLYRQLGTAQAEAVYAALFAGHSIGMSWSAALDSALADTLADQLQVLARDEQRVLLAAIEHAADAAALAARVAQIVGRLPGPRQVAHLSQLKAHENPAVGPIDDMNPASLAVEQARFLFGEDPSNPPVIPAHGLFANRLRAFVNERGL